MYALADDTIYNISGRKNMLGISLPTTQLSQQTQKEAKCKPFVPSIFWLYFVKRWPTEI